jgi:imidazolonepropionase-like amidohydrolase
MTRSMIPQLTGESLRTAHRHPLRFGLPVGILTALFCSCTWAQSVAVEHVTVIDATGRAAQPDRTVVVDGDRIVAVVPAKKAHVPKNAEIVDGAGKFLIPGLWDMHVHGASDARAPWSHLLFIANGVVGVRDMAGPLDAHAWRAAQASNPDPSPDLYLASPIIDGPNPVWPDSLVANDEAQGREEVDQQQQRGADFIKVYSRLSRNVYFAIADEANKRGIPFEGHVPELVTAAEASSAGQRSIEHLTRVADACSKDASAIDAELQRYTTAFRTPDATLAQKIDAGRNIIRLNSRTVASFDEATAQSLFALFVKNGTWQCPTLTLLRAQIDDPLPADDPRLGYLSKDVRAKWDAGYYRNLPAGPRAAMVALTKAEFEESKRIVGLMYRAGVPLLAGTDAMNPECFPGFSIHDELALLVDAGLTPLAALQAATRNPAQFMGQFDRRGTIEAGKIADLVLLDADPLADIHNTRAVRAVVLSGKLYRREALDAMLLKAQALANGRDASAAE